MTHRTHITSNILIFFINWNSCFFQHKEKHHFHLVKNNQLSLISMLFLFNQNLNIYFFNWIHFSIFNHMGFQIAWIFSLTELFKNDLVLMSTIWHAQCSFIFFGFFVNPHVKLKSKTYLIGQNIDRKISQEAENFSTEWNFEWDWYAIKKKDEIQSQENQGVILAEGPKEKKHEKKQRLLKEIPRVAQRNAFLEKGQYLRQKYDWFWKNSALPYLVFSLALLTVCFFFNFLWYVLSAHPFNIIAFGFFIFAKYQNLFFWVFGGSVLGGIFLGLWGWHNIYNWRLKNTFQNFEHEVNKNIQNQINQILHENTWDLEQQNRELEKIYRKLIHKNTILEQNEEIWQLNRWWRNHPALFFGMVCLFMFFILLIINLIWYGISPNNMYSFWKYLYIWIKY